MTQFPRKSLKMTKAETEIHNIFKKSPQTLEFRKLRKRIIRLTRETIQDYSMIESGGKWLVCISGGKDSYTLLDILIHFQK